MKFPYFRQTKKYLCGPAAFRMLLALIGRRQSESTLTRLLKTTPKVGTPNAAFVRVAEDMRLSFCVGRDASLEELQQRLDEGWAVMVGYFDDKDRVGHYAILRSLNKNSVCLADPDYSPTYRLDRSRFEQLWKKGFSFDPDHAWYFAVRRPLKKKRN